MIGDISLLGLVVLIVSVLISLTIHEFMHAFVGHKLGDPTAFESGRVSFNPLQHIDPVMTVALPIITIILPPHVPILAAKPVPFDPRFFKNEYGPALVAAAGPLSNLVLAFIAALLSTLVVGGSLVHDILRIFAELNVAIFVFNFIPIPPLDGSRVLYAFAPEPVRDLFDRIEPIGIFIIFALVLMGGLGGILGNLNQAVLNFLP